MALQTVPYYLKGYYTTYVNIGVTAQAAVMCIINTILIGIKNRSDCFTNADLSAGFSYTHIRTISVDSTRGS